MKKALAIVLAALMVLAVVAGCGETPASSSSSEAPSSSSQSSSAAPSSDAAAGKQVMINMGSINHPVHRIVQLGFVSKAEELGMEGVIVGLDEGSLQELITKFESGVTNGAEGALVWTGDDSMYEMLKGFQEDGCHVVVPHFAHEYADTKDFIDRNLCCLAASYGKASADFILDKLAEKGVTSGSIGITQNGPNVTENAANDSFRAEMAAKNAPFKLLDTVFEGPEIVEATNKVTAVINSADDIVAGFGTTGGSPQSWSAAMENTGKTDLVVIGMDYTELNINLVKEGKITAIVGQPLYTEAQESAQSLYNIFNGEDYTVSPEKWFLELDAPLIYNGGEGPNDPDTYADIIEAVKNYNW